MIAEGLLGAGCKVYITSRNENAVAKTQSELSSLGECVGLTSDLASPAAIAALAAVFKSHEQRLDILVNNAGKTWSAPLEAFPDNAWPEAMALNVQIPFTLVRELLNLLKAAGCASDPSRIINIGSIAGATVQRLSAYAYAASKAAIHHLTRDLAAELAQHHITANVIVPGYFPTRMTDHIRREDSATQKLLAQIPLARMGRAADIAGACIFLSASAGSYVTGSALFLDGGMAGCG
jgi:NAD(P)-dependent dehydrogenase (short-subunit alcohol dehydrogenase family)